MNIRYYTPTLYLDDILIRKSPPAYQDGVYEPAGQDRPNPFTISEIAHKGQSGLGSARNRTAMLVYFGKTFELSYKSIWKTTNFDFYFSNWKNFRVRIFFPKCVAVDLILKTIFITSSGIMFDPESFSLDQTLRISNRVLWEENKITRKSCVEEINKDKGEMKKKK